MVELTVIRLVQTEKEREEAHSLITKLFMQYFKTSPPLPTLLFAAFCENTIVGTAGLEVSDEKNFLPYNHIYRLSQHINDFFPNQNAIQYARWTATKPGVSAALFYAATVCGIQLNKRFSWSISKPRSIKRLEDFGVYLRRVESAALIEENIPAYDKTYFETQPYPALYIGSLEQAGQALAHTVFSPSGKKKFIFEL